MYKFKDKSLTLEEAVRQCVQNWFGVNYCLRKQDVLIANFPDEIDVPLHHTTPAKIIKAESQVESEKSIEMITLKKHREFMTSAEIQHKDGYTEIIGYLYYPKDHFCSECGHFKYNFRELQKMNPIKVVLWKIEE